MRGRRRGSKHVGAARIRGGRASRSPASKSTTSSARGTFFATQRVLAPWRKPCWPGSSHRHAGHRPRFITAQPGRPLSARHEVVATWYRGGRGVALGVMSARSRSAGFLPTSSTRFGILELARQRRSRFPSSRARTLIACSVVAGKSAGVCRISRSTCQWRGFLRGPRSSAPRRTPGELRLRRTYVGALCDVDVGPVGMLRARLAARGKSRFTPRGVVLASSASGAGGTLDASWQGGWPTASGETVVTSGAMAVSGGLSHRHRIPLRRRANPPADSSPRS